MSTAIDPGIPRIAVAGWGIHVPDVDLTARIGVHVGAPACPPERAQELLGSRGLLYKESATRLALCAVHRALDLSPRAPRAQSPPHARVAVVASSNLGNVATVQSVVRTLRTTGLREVSALDAPNASSNVLASTVAIWFRFGGPNLMVCSGATSGLDAVSLGCVLLRTHRADRVVVVGAEPDDEAATALNARRLARVRGERLRAGAAAVVLERKVADRAGIPLLGPMELGAALHGLEQEEPSAVIGPEMLARGPTRIIDLTRAIGDLYGATGVLQIAVAAALIGQSSSAATPQSVAVICGDDVDGFRSTIVRDSAIVVGAIASSKGLAV